MNTRKKTTNVLRILFTALAIFLVMLSCSTEKKEVQIQKNLSDKIATISTMDELNNLINNESSKILVFDLYADWCMPCKILSPIFSSLADTHHEKARFFRVNVDKSPDIANAFGTQGIPYVVFIRNKKAIHALTGLNPKENYDNVITACGSAESAEACSKVLEAL
jgi:thioredoxin 1